MKDTFEFIKFLGPKATLTVHFKKKRRQNKIIIALNREESDLSRILFPVKISSEIKDD